MKVRAFPISVKLNDKIMTRYYRDADRIKISPEHRRMLQDMQAEYFEREADELKRKCPCCGHEWEITYENDGKSCIV